MLAKHQDITKVISPSLTKMKMTNRELNFQKAFVVGGCAVKTMKQTNNPPILNGQPDWQVGDVFLWETVRSEI